MLGVDGSLEMDADWKLEPVGCCGHGQIRSLQVMGFISTLSSLFSTALSSGYLEFIDLSCVGRQVVIGKMTGNICACRESTR